MSFQFLKSKKFFIFVFIIILLAGGLFYWQQQRPTSPEDWDTAEVSERGDYEIVEQDDGLLVKNEEAGLSLKVPEGWEFEENFSASSNPGVISFASPDMVTATRTSVIKRGCRLKIGVGNIKTNIEMLKEEIPKRFSDYSNVTLEDQEIIKIQDNKAIKHLFRDEKYKMNYMTIHLAEENKTYEIFLDTALKNQEKCKQEFDEILDTVSIK